MLTIVIFVIGLLLWAGMILGISCLESWVKFQATGLTKIAALSVGRTVFNAFHKVQLAFLLLLILIGVNAYLNRFEWFLMLIIACSFVIQTFVILPKLNKRVEQRLNGVTPAPSQLHHGYSFLELLKLIIILWLALKLLFMIAHLPF